MGSKFLCLCKKVGVNFMTYLVELNYLKRNFSNESIILLLNFSNILNIFSK